MKKFLFLLMVCFIGTHVNAQQNFKIKPQKPVSGATITFEWLTRNTLLQGQTDIEGTAYLMYAGNKLPRAVPLTLKKEGGLVTGSVLTDDSTKAVFFSFSKDEIVENNNDSGYYTFLYDEAGKEIMGSHLAVATAFNSYGGIWRMKRNVDKATKHYEKEFANPAAKEMYAGEYLFYLSTSKNEADKEVFKRELEKMANKKDSKEADLQSVRAFYEVNLKDKEKAAQVFEKMKERFPDGMLRKRIEAVTAFNMEKDLGKKAELYEGMRKHSSTKDDQVLLDGLASQLAYRFADSSDYENMQKYTAIIKSNSAKAGVFNNVAWKLAGEGVHGKPINAEMGKRFSMEALELMKKEMKELTGKPVYMTNAQYAKALESDYHNYADTYAVLLYHSGEFEKAYEIQKKAVEHYGRKNVNLNTSYTAMIEKTKGKEAAREELEKFFEEGKYTPAMKEQFKNLYLADNKTEEDWAKYTVSLEEKAFNRIKGEIAKNMINIPAPQFTLRNLDGKDVSLASLKGKVVVVDFWATWCGPCIASFPGMKKAIEKYKNHPEVAFIFIDTWETGDDREKKVTDFIAQNKYPFQVLYDQQKSKDNDSEFIVVQEYKVEGIPTKFVIDRNSNIRFKSVGMNGNPDEMVVELTAMIDMAAAESGGPLKKAF